MMHGSYASIGVREPGSKRVNVVIETPAGSRGKYKYDEGLELFRLHKILPLGSAFPFDFGFVPNTLGDDGDALDVIVLADVPTFSGCLVTVRLLGAIEAKQTQNGRTIRNDRLVGAAETEKIRPAARAIGDLPSRVLDQIEQFFVSYNLAEGRRFVPLRRSGPAAAARLIDQGIRRHRATPTARNR